MVAMGVSHVTSSLAALFAPPGPAEPDTLLPPSAQIGLTAGSKQGQSDGQDQNNGASHGCGSYELRLAIKLAAYLTRLSRVPPVARLTNDY